MGVLLSFAKLLILYKDKNIYFEPLNAIYDSLALLLI